MRTAVDSLGRLLEVVSDLVNDELPAALDEVTEDDRDALQELLSHVSIAQRRLDRARDEILKRAGK